MTRGVDATMLAALGESVIRPAYFVHLGFRDAVTIWTGNVSATAHSKTWLPYTGELGISDLSETLDGSQPRLSVSLTGYSPDQLEPYGLPVLEATPTTASIAGTSATLGGEITDDGGTSVTERGIVYAPTASTPDPLIGSATAVTSGTGTGVFTASVTGLTPATQYSFRAYAKNSQGYSYSNAITFTTAFTAPVLAAPSASAVEYTTARLSGTITEDGGLETIERGFVYSQTATNSTPTIGGTGVTSVFTTRSVGVGSGFTYGDNFGLYADGEFRADVYGLAAGTGYSYRAYAKNSQGTSYSSTATMTTDAAAVPAPTATEIAPIAHPWAGSALVYCNLFNLDGDVITERGIVISQTSVNATPAIGGTGVTKIGTTESPHAFNPAQNSVIKRESGVILESYDTYRALATGLTAGTSYSIRAYAINDQGTGYSSVATVTTPAAGGSLVSITTVSSIPAARSVSVTTTFGSGTATSAGLLVSETAVNADPLITGDDIVGKHLQGNFAGSSQAFVTGGLKPNTEYSMRVYVTSNAGITYSSLTTFTTPADKPALDSTPAASSVTETTATLGGDITARGITYAPQVDADGGATVTARGVVYAPTATNSNPTIGGSGVINAPHASGGTGAFTVNVSGLTAGTDYSFRTYATNSQGTTYSTANVGTFATVKAPLSAVAAPPPSTNLPVQGLVYFGLVDSAGAIIGSPQLMFSGLVDATRFTIDPTRNVQTSLELHGAPAIVEAKTAKRYTDTHQQSLYTGDLGLEYAEATAAVKLRFGSTP